MKNVILFTIVLVFLGIKRTEAQSFAKGQSSISIGLGFPNLYKTSSDLLFAGQPAEDTPKESNIPPISFLYEYGITDEISIGAQYSFTQQKWSSGGSSLGFRFSVIGLRGAYHLQKTLKISNDKFDPYVGAMLGYYTSKFFVKGIDLDSQEKAIFENLTVSDFSWQGYIGSKYHFTKNFSAFGELGYGFSIANIGATFRF